MIRIGLDDYLAIAAELLSLDSLTVAKVVRIPLADSALHAPFAEFGSVEFYPDPIQKAGILCSRLVRNHPLPDGNKRAAYLSMLVFLDVNGIAWQPPSEDERVSTIEALASGALGEEAFVECLRAHTEVRDPSDP